MSQTYNEEAFRYFLTAERKRSQRSQTSFLLLLVSVKKQSGMTRIPPDLAASIFSGLWQSVREADFIGWFRDERVAGAVLTQAGNLPTADVVAAVTQRISETLWEHVPSPVASRIQVRVLQLRPPQER